MDILSDAVGVCELSLFERELDEDENLICTAFPALPRAFLV